MAKVRLTPRNESAKIGDTKITINGLSPGGGLLNVRVSDSDGRSTQRFISRGDEVVSPGGKVVKFTNWGGSMNSPEFDFEG